MKELEDTVSEPLSLSPLPTKAPDLGAVVACLGATYKPNVSDLRAMRKPNLLAFTPGAL